MVTAEISPLNSLLLVMDRSVGIVPPTMGRSVVAFTETCVAVGTRSEHDGSTRVTVVDGVFQVDAGAPVFDGVLLTPGGSLAVCSVVDEVVVEFAVNAPRTRVRIWANDPVEPSEITLLASEYVAT